MTTRCLLALCSAVGLAVQVPSAMADADVAMLEIEGGVAEVPSPFEWLMGGEPTLLDYIDVLDEAAADGDLGGVVIRLKDAALLPSQVEELGRAIERARTAGKRVDVFAESYGPTELMLAAYADGAYVQTGGGVSLPGLFMEEMYLADTLSWAGMHADMVQVGDYKGANEQMTRAAPSDAWDENISGLLDAMYAEMVRKFTEIGDLTPEQLDQAMAELWFGDGAKAVEAGLLDAEVDLLDLFDHLAGVYGEPVAYAGKLEAGIDGPEFDAANPFAMLGILTQEPETRATGPTIAVLHVDGPIVDGDSTVGGLMGGASVGSRTLRSAMQDIADDDNIRGVVVRIDSPGGSATASEMIWQGLDRLSDSKPVWVSVGSMAASGGYYTAVGGDKIYVNPSSIVGSIGVVGGKVTFGELADRVKVNVVERARGPRAGMLSATSRWTDEEREIVRAEMARTYEQFTARVTEGRPGIDLSKTAEGRLFLGADAVRLGMADEIGGLDDAIADLAEQLFLDEYDVMHFPGPKSLEELLDETFGGFLGVRSAAVVVESPLVTAARGVLGDERFEAIRSQIEAMMLLRENRVVLTLPKIVHVR